MPLTLRGDEDGDGVPKLTFDLELGIRTGHDAVRVKPLPATILPLRCLARALYLVHE